MVFCFFLSSCLFHRSGLDKKLVETMDLALMEGITFAGFQRIMCAQNYHNHVLLNYLKAKRKSDFFTSDGQLPPDVAKSYFEVYGTAPSANYLKEMYFKKHTN